MDKLVRKLTDKATGLPIVDAIVVARPVSASGSEADISLVETPAGSGIYASTSQVDHDTYKIIVNWNDSLDEFTVEAGRAEQVISDSAVSYPLIDRIVSAKLHLPAVLDDKAYVVTPAQFKEALIAASFSSDIQRELVLDQSVTIETGASLAGDLLVDLNGHTLNLGADIVSSTGRISFRNGTIFSLAAGPKIQGIFTSFVNISFAGDGITSLVREDGNLSFIGCYGLPSLAGAEAYPKTVPSVCGGAHGFATADMLKLTDRNSKTGNGRLADLQGFINDHIIAVVANAGAEGVGWLNAMRRARLDRWVNLTDAKIERIEEGETTDFRYAVSYLNFNIATPTELRRYGINCGIVKWIDGRFNQINQFKIVSGENYVGPVGGTLLIPCGQLTQAQWDELKLFADGAQVSNVSVQSPARLVPKIWSYTIESVTNIVSMIPVQTSLTCSLRFDWNGGLSTKMVVVEGVAIDYSNGHGWDRYLVDLDIMNSSLFNLPSTRFVP